MIFKVTILFAAFYSYFTVVSSLELTFMDRSRTSGNVGLYEMDERVHVLEANTFEENVIDSATAWLVEFYNSWCGHCIQFAPVWKDFGDSVAPWSKVVRVGAVECSHEMNADLCRDHRITRYPTLRYFEPYTSKGNCGNETDTSYEVDVLRKMLIKKLVNTTPVSGWPSMAFYNSTDVFEVWSNVPSSVEYAVFFVEEKPSENEDISSSGTPGVELILDTSAIPEIYATRVASDKPPAQQLQLPVVPGIAVLTRDNDIIPVSIDVVENTRDNRLEALVKYLKLQGVNASFPSSDDESGRSTNADAADNIDTIHEVLRLDQEDIVYQADLETALRYSLERDVPLKASNIEGERLEALKSYIHILTKYFPFNDKGRKFLSSLNASVSEKSFSPVKFQETVTNLTNEYDPFLMKDIAYIGCDSRFPGLRGYPCTLWTLFHTLTVAAESKPHLSSEPKEVLHAMQGYIKHFFSCTDCAKNFSKETRNLEESVNSLDDSILYLWKTHNHVNARLHEYPGNRTEDPDHPKIQFPSVTHCPQCHASSGDWNETAVLSYLKSIYTKVHNKTDLHNTSSRSLKKREINLTMTPLFLIGLCAFIYLALAIMIGLLLRQLFKSKGSEQEAERFDDVPDLLKI